LYRSLTGQAFSLTFLPVIMGLFVYARHTVDCSNRDDRFWRRCRCPKWIRGTLGGKSVRRTAKTRSWERAEAELQRLSGFLWFCVRNEWLEKNPARMLKAIRVKQIPTDYFTREEIKRIVDATYAYGDWQGGHDFHHRAEKLRALILLMRWSGLAIRDAVTLERERLTSGNKLFLYRAKTNVPVYLPLPSQLADLLRSLPNSNPRYFFWTGNGDPETVKKGWDRSLRRLFKAVKLRKPDGTLKRCHAHMFRDTFAVELLLAGVPLDQVSLLLGHASIKVTERHYAPFVKARQEQLEASTLRAWAVMESYGDSVEQATFTLNQRLN
jgi:integrase